MLILLNAFSLLIYDYLEKESLSIKPSKAFLTATPMKDFLNLKNIDNGAKINDSLSQKNSLLLPKPCLAILGHIYTKIARWV